MDALIKAYGMKPHPEGGFYAETYRSDGIIPKGALPPGFAGDRAFCTAILYLLPGGGRSRLHRIASDELWHFHLGGTLTVVELGSGGRATETRLGADLKNGERLQHRVPGGTWFGAYVGDGVPFALVGCTVAPGFDFADFELGERAALLKDHPDERKWVEFLTR